MKSIDKANRMLRAKSIECLTLVGMEVGHNKFQVIIMIAYMFNIP